MRKNTMEIQRNDGSQVKLVALAYFGTGLHLSVGIDTFYRKSSDDEWQLCDNSRHPNIKTMSRQDYLDYGKSEAMRVTTIAERLKVAQPIWNSYLAEFPPV